VHSVKSRMSKRAGLAELQKTRKHWVPPAHQCVGKTRMNPKLSNPGSNTSPIRC